MAEDRRNTDWRPNVWYARQSEWEEENAGLTVIISPLLGPEHDATNTYCSLAKLATPYQLGIPVFSPLFNSTLSVYSYWSLSKLQSIHTEASNVHAHTHTHPYGSRITLAPIRFEAHKAYVDNYPLILHL